MGIKLERNLQFETRTPLSLGVIDLRVLAKDVPLVLIGFIATLVVALPIGYGTGFLVSPTPPAFEPLDWFIDIAKIVFFEEILFRALIFGGLHNRLGLVPAIVLSAAIFGSLHLIQFPMPMAIMAGWAGVVLAWQYAKSRRLSTPILTHAMIIVVQFFVLP